MSDQVRLPDFLYIGPPKAGSSWLFHVLSQHPDVYVPPAKDLYFFDRFYERGLDWYTSFFRHAEDASRVGELSHDYLYSTEARDRIANVIPDVRLLVMLRDPVDRAVSHYMQSVRNDNVEGSFEQALQQNPTILSHGLYGRYLDSYLKRFSREQLTVLWFDDLKRDAGRLAEQVFRALGVTPMTVDVSPMNSAVAPRNRLLARTAREAAAVLRHLGLANVLGRVKRGPVRELFFRQVDRDERPELQPDESRELRSFFEADTELLEEVIGERPPWAVALDAGRNS